MAFKVDFSKLGEKKPFVPYDMGNILVVGFTGHRPNKLGGYRQNPLRNAIKRAMLEMVNTIIEENPDKEVVIVWGGALGVDQWAAALANHLGLRHCAILPFREFDNKWPAASRRELTGLLSTSDADLARMVYERFNNDHNYRTLELDQYNNCVWCAGWVKYNAELLQWRNMVMVDVSDRMIAVWDGTAGGTHNCVQHIWSAGKELDIINPNDYR